MIWKGRRQSENVDDRRGRAPNTMDSLKKFINVMTTQISRDLGLTPHNQPMVDSMNEAIGRARLQQELKQMMRPTLMQDGSSSIIMSKTPSLGLDESKKKKESK